MQAILAPVILAQAIWVEAHRLKCASALCVSMESMEAPLLPGASQPHWITYTHKGTCGQGYLGFAQMYLELELLLELLLQLLLELLLELLLLLLLSWLPRPW